MREVEIYYNPYLKTTRLIVDHAERCGSASRIDDYIIGKPMSNWLAAYSESYYHWDGILPELMEDLNDDELNIVFHGFQEHYEMLEQAAQLQRGSVEALGFEFTHWKLRHQAAYSTRDFLNALSAFVARFKPEAPDQRSLRLFEQVEEDIGQTENPTVEGLVGMTEVLRAAVADATSYYSGQTLRNYSVRINYWKDVERRLSHILEGGAR